MSTLARILCAVDLDKASERAFERALNLAMIGNDAGFFLIPSSRSAWVTVLGAGGSTAPRSFCGGRRGPGRAPRLRPLCLLYSISYRLGDECPGLWVAVPLTNRGSAYS
jgi:hypothetical protein